MVDGHEEAMRRARQHVLRRRAAAGVPVVRAAVRLTDVLAVEWAPASARVEVPENFDGGGVRSGTIRVSEVDARWQEQVYSFLARRGRVGLVFGTADEPFQLEGRKLWSVQFGRSEAAPLPRTHDEWIAAARRHVADARFRAQRERLLSETEIPLTYTIGESGGTYSITASLRPWWRPWWTYAVGDALRSAACGLGLR